LAEGFTGLFMQCAGDFQDLFPQLAGDEHGAVFQRAADIVRACGKCALHCACAFLDDASLPFECLFDLLDIGCDGIRNKRALGRDLIDVTRYGAVDVAADVRQLGEVTLQRLGEQAAALCQLADMASDDVVDTPTLLGDLGKIGFKRTPQDVAALGKLLDLAGDEAVNACTAFSQLGEVVLQRLGKRRAVGCQPFHMAVNKPVHAFQIVLKRLSELGAIGGDLLRLLCNDASYGFEVRLQGALEDVATLRQLLDLPGDEAVNACTAFRKLGKVGFQSLGEQTALFGKLVRMLLYQLAHIGKV